MPPDLGGDSLDPGRFGFNNLAKARRELIEGNDLVKDRSIGRRKLARDCFPPDPTPDPGDSRPPSFHLEPDKVGHENGDVADDQAARGSHNHDYSYARESATRVDGEDDDDYVTPFENVGEEQNPAAPFGSSFMRIVTWDTKLDYVGRIEAGPIYVYTRYSGDAGATWYGDWAIRCVVPPASEVAYFEVRGVPFDSIVTLTVEVHLQPQNHDRSAAMKVTRTGTDGKLSASFMPESVPTAVPVPIAEGGTSQVTAVDARGASGLNVESGTAHGDTDYNILQTDRLVRLSAALTSPRTWTLPAASTFKDGQTVVVSDMVGGISAVNTLTIARFGADTIDGDLSIVLAGAYDSVKLVSDGVSKWHYPVPGLEQGGTGAKTATAARTNLGLGTVATLAVDTDGALAANSDVRVPSQKATKTYADGVAAAAAASLATEAGIRSAADATQAADILTEAGARAAADAAEASTRGTADSTEAGARAAADSAHAASVDHPVMVGDGGAGGTKGMVPAPAAGDAAANKVLLADGTWGTPPGGAPSGAAGGDLSGTYPNPGVTKVAGVTPGAGGLALLDDADAAAGRSTLGLGNSATKDVGTTTGKVAAGDDARLSDSRAPNGSAGGGLGGSYPNPTVAGRYLSSARVDAGTTSFVVPAGASKARFRLQGPGGGGGGAGDGVGQSGFGSGGGAGGYLEIIRAVTASGTINCVLPVGGTGASAGANAGNAASADATVTVGSDVFTAIKGNPGLAGTSTATILARIGGGGAAVSTTSGTPAADDRYDGGQQGGTAMVATATTGYSGFGGMARLGVGGKGQSSAAAGGAAVGYGGGGGGGGNPAHAGTAAGGNGGDSVLFVDYYS